MTKAMKHQSHNNNNNNSSSRRTPSFSSSSSSSSSSYISYNPNSTNPIDNNTPLTTPSSTPGRFSGGVPFSWEHFPGIPKRQLSKKKTSESPPSSTTKTTTTTKLIPLVPPPTISLDQEYYTSIIRVKKSTSFSTNNSNPNSNKHHRNLETNDPFFAALVECSKDERHDHSIRDSTSHNSKFWSIATAKVSRSLSDRFGFVTVYSSCKRTCVVTESIRHLPRSSTRSYDLINNRSR